MKKYLNALILTLLFSSTLFGQENTFTIEQMKSDIVYLKKQLESNQPNLFIYTSKEKLNNTFDSLSVGLSKPLTELEFYKHITVLSSSINDGHTIILPSSSITNYHNSNSNFLPYHFTIIDNKLYVDMVCTNDNSIPISSEIQSINNVNAKEIIEQLTSRQIRDGYNTTYPLWILNNYFREYYSYIFGHPNQFDIRFQTNSQTQTATINALPKDSINYYKVLKYSNRILEPKKNEGITLNFSKDNSIATLTIKNFHNSVLRKVYHQNFKKAINRCFKEVQNSGAQSLILDLRDNQGGDIPNGVLLVSYLLDKPFSIVQSFYKVGKSGDLVKTNGQSLGVFEPKENSFKGKLYVLINGGSFSNSGVVSSCLKRNDRGIFIGEETGGNNKVLAGYIKNISLPNSKIRVQIPTKQYLLDNNLPLTGHGTLPDFPIRRELLDIINNSDNIMNSTIELIKQQKNK